MYPAFDLKSNIEPKLSNHDATLSGTTANTGDAVDCANYDGPIYALAQVAAATGTPDSFTVTAKLTESDTSGGTYTDLATQTTGTDAVLSANNTAKIIRGIRTKRYVKVVLTPAFVGGSSPGIDASSAVLGQLRNVT